MHIYKPKNVRQTIQENGKIKSINVSMTCHQPPTTSSWCLSSFVVQKMLILRFSFYMKINNVYILYALLVSPTYPQSIYGCIYLQK
jgi:hypothetical protein